MSTIAEYERMMAIRINDETAEEIEYLRSLIRDEMSMDISRSLIIRTLIRDAVIKNRAQQYYRQNTTHNRQESTDELGK